jgi:hypothetical protein
MESTPAKRSTTSLRDLYLDVSNWRGVGLSFGGGFQIATSQFYRNNHNGILTIRFPF